MMKKILLPVFLAAVAGIVGYFAYDRMTGSDRKTDDAALEQQARQDQRTIDALKEKVSILQEILEKEEDTSIPKEEIARAFGDKNAEVSSPEVADLSCEELQRRLMSFFKYLDERNYIQPHGLNESAQEFFQKTISRLTDHEPQITGEMQELPILMKNMAYFYRVLGRKRVEIIIDVLHNEADIIESAMTIFNQYYQLDTECQIKTVHLPPLETTYNYALFFLNTLAGKNYLLRRNSKIRIITTYYCILIIDRANEKGLNRYGFDVRPQIAMLLSDMNDHKRLVYKVHYREELKKLQRKYVHQ